MKLKYSNLLQNITNFENKVNTLTNIFYYGYLVGIHGFVLEVIGLKAPIGAECFVERVIDGKILNLNAKVVGFKKEKTLLFSLDENYGIFPGARVFLKLSQNINYIFKKYPLGIELLGRILDSSGNPLDGKIGFSSKHFFPLHRNNINPLHRAPINKILDTGIRAINALMTIGQGQRIGIFSSSGVGKSILLGMMSKYTKSDVIVIALIGERGREVQDFIKNILGLEGLLRSVVIVAPADVSPLLKIEAASYATAVAEYFCQKQKKNVLLIMDSLTRYAMAQREVSLSLGELPVSKGYPSSIFSQIPLLVERTGNISNNKSITAFYTILTENEEDQQDPIAHLCRSILDGHILLSRNYSDAGHYPAIDLASSISRVMPDIVSNQQYSQACYFKKLVSIYQKNRELINIGAYISGTNPLLDQSIKLWPKLEKFLQQNQLEKSNYIDSCRNLNKIFI